MKKKGICKMFTNEELCAKLADNLRNGVVTPESVIEVLDAKGNENILELVISYLFITQQDDLIRLLYNTGLKLEQKQKSIEFLEKCLELN